MQHYKNILLFVLCLFLLVACNPQPEAPVLLEQAQLLMEDNPDSALLLIDSIFYPEKSLNKHDYMYYQVAKVQAKYKAYRPVKEDTLIFEARRYFEKHNKDLKKNSLAHFYSGCVYREQYDNHKLCKHTKMLPQLHK